MSLRQLAEQTGISNPYLSQIERGLRKPSAEVLLQLSKALRVSAETLYVRAGILDPDDHPATSVEMAVLADMAITERQKRVLIDVYTSFVKENEKAATTGKPQNDQVEPNREKEKAMSEKETFAEARKSALESDYAALYAVAGLTDALAEALKGALADTQQKASKRLNELQSKRPELSKQAKSGAEDAAHVRDHAAGAVQAPAGGHQGPDRRAAEAGKRSAGSGDDAPTATSLDAASKRSTRYGSRRMTGPPRPRKPVTPRSPTMPQTSARPMQRRQTGH